MDVDKLLEELSPDAVCGDDLEYDPAFTEMERAAEGKPEQQFGDTLVPAEEPEWRTVRSNALELLSRSKDIRVVAHLLRANLAMQDLPAFRDSLCLIRGLINDRWDSFHPQLDPDDNNDPTMRINVIASLCDTDSTIRLLQHAHIVQSPMAGRFSLRDIGIAKGEIPAPEGEDEKPAEMSLIEAAFSEAAVEGMQETTLAIGQAAEYTREIEQRLTEHVGSANAVSLGAFVKMLDEIIQILRDRLARRGANDPLDEAPPDEEEQPDAETAADGAPTEAGQAPVANVVQVAVDEITTRQQVVEALNKICEYYDRYEPSSPLPLLIKRAKRLASMSFLEILRELSPEALSAAQSMAGIESSEEAQTSE